MAKVIIYLRDHEFTAQPGMIAGEQPVPSHQTDLLLSEFQDKRVVEGG